MHVCFPKNIYNKSGYDDSVLFDLGYIFDNSVVFFILTTFAFGGDISENILVAKRIVFSRSLFK